MQRSKRARSLDFIPQTFVLPNESRELLTAHFRYRGPWIVKPKASSRGRGIYIVNSVSIFFYNFQYFEINAFNLKKNININFNDFSQRKF